MKTAQSSSFLLTVGLLAILVFSCGEREGGSAGVNDSNVKVVDRGFGISATDADFGDFITDVVSYYSPEMNAFKEGVLPLGKPVFEASKGPFYAKFEERINSASAVLLGRNDAQVIFINLGRKGWLIWPDQEEQEPAKATLELTKYLSSSDRKVVMREKNGTIVEAVSDVKFR